VVSLHKCRCAHTCVGFETLSPAPADSPRTCRDTQGGERPVGCFSGITASVTSPSVRAALETADVVTVQAAQYVQTTVVPAVVASRDYVQANAVPALQRGWAYLRDVVFPAADAFVRDTAVPTLIRVANDVIMPAANSTAAYTRHVVVPTTVAYYHHYVSGQPLPLPGTFAVPAVSQQVTDRSTLRPPDGSFGSVSSREQDQPVEQGKPRQDENVAAPTEEA
jgi:hypothetical protein